MDSPQLGKGARLCYFVRLGFTEWGQGGVGSGLENLLILELFCPGPSKAKN
jgi:hypothetical protein